MRDATLVLTIDAGGSGVKASVLCVRTCQVLGSARREYRASYPEPDQAEFDNPERLHERQVRLKRVELRRLSGHDPPDRGIGAPPQWLDESHRVRPATRRPAVTWERGSTSTPTSPWRAAPSPRRAHVS